MKLTFLGTGTSFGVPVVGCDCAVCTSDDPRDRRTRHGALLETDGGATVLIDTPPELRLQLLDAGCRSVDAVWITHTHADHVHGFDDLRIFTLKMRRDLTVYAPEKYAEELTRRFYYVFDSNVRPPAGTTKPEIDLRTFDRDAVEVAGETFTPLEVPHPPISAYGFRVGDLGYVTDAKTIPDRVMAELEGVRVMVLNALWFGDPHPTHLIMEEALEFADRIGAERTYITHLTHRTSHAELSGRLPSHVRPAYDGLTVEI